MACFKSDESSLDWKAYVEYLDEMVVEGFFNCISCSLNYLLENTDAKNNVYPLFEARLELQAPDMVFVPSLDYNVPNGLYDLIDGIIADIYKQSSLVSRLAAHNGHEQYQVHVKEYNTFRNPMPRNLTTCQIPFQEYQIVGETRALDYMISKLIN